MSKKRTISDIINDPVRLRALAAQSANSPRPVEIPYARAGETRAVLDVLAERRRQIEVEGWTAEHDDSHADGALERAAACYAWAASLSDEHRDTYAMPSENRVDESDNRIWFNVDVMRKLWTWARRWWKPTTRRQDLVKSCALSLAAIERIDRAAARERQS